MPSTVINFEIEVDPSLVPVSMIGSLLDHLSDFSAVLLDQIGTELQQEQFANFESKGATFGRPWAPLAPSTIAEKRRLGYPDETLVRTGRLAANVGEAIRVSPNSVTVGVDTDAVPYAERHDYGGGNTPQRVLVSVTGEDVDKLLDMLQQYVSNLTGLSPDIIKVVQV